jgi:hypothetical protein
MHQEARKNAGALKIQVTEIGKPSGKCIVKALLKLEQEQAA